MLSDALIISPYIYDSNITEPHEANANESNGSFDRLELNKVRYFVPYPNVMTNLNMRLNFDGGIIEIINESCDIQLSMGDENRPWDYSGGGASRKFSNRLSVPDGGYIAINPLASKSGYTRINKGDPNWDMSDGYVGRKYYLTVNAYDFFDVDSPVITAKIEIVQLEDTAFPDGNGSSYYSIELISYEYSDTYKLMEAER